MKIEIRVSDNLVIHAEGDKADDIFEQIATAQETFEDSCCAQCKNKNLRYVVRKVDDNKFFEIHCTNPQCRAKLTFGRKKKEQTLYPKRSQVETEGKNKGKVKRDADGKAVPLGKWGWHIYKAGEQPSHEGETEF